MKVYQNIEQSDAVKTEEEEEETKVFIYLKKMVCAGYVYQQSVSCLVASTLAGILAGWFSSMSLLRCRIHMRLSCCDLA